MLHWGVVGLNKKKRSKVHKVLSLTANMEGGEGPHPTWLCLWGRGAVSVPSTALRQLRDLACTAWWAGNHSGEEAASANYHLGARSLCTYDRDIQAARERTGNQVAHAQNKSDLGKGRVLGLDFLSCKSRMKMKSIPDRCKLL